MNAWYKDETLGACFKTTIKAEVAPDQAKLETVVKNAQDHPSAPLSLKVWTDKKTYGKGEKMMIFVKGNKHFFARVIYRNAAGEVLQPLPNPHRKNNFFSSETVHELPSGDDRYDIEVIAPYGEEKITVFGSTAQLGDIDLKQKSAVYEVKTKPEDIPVKTRGVALVGKAGAADDGTADFAEAEVTVTTENR